MPYATRAATYLGSAAMQTLSQMEWPDTATMVHGTAAAAGFIGACTGGLSVGTSLATCALIDAVVDARDYAGGWGALARGMTKPLTDPAGAWQDVTNFVCPPMVKTKVLTEAIYLTASFVLPSPVAVSWRLWHCAKYATMGDRNIAWKRDPVAPGRYRPVQTWTNKRLWGS